MADWIPVSEALPSHCFVLICVRRRDEAEADVKLGYYSADRDEWRYQSGLRLEVWETVTHWMPRPAPPGGDRGRLPAPL